MNRGTTPIWKTTPGVARSTFLKLGQWCAEGGEGSVGTRRVLRGRPDPDVEILGGSNVPVGCERVSTDHQRL